MHIGIGARQTVYDMLLQFLVTLQTEILLTETSDCLSQIIFLKSFDSLFKLNRINQTESAIFVSLMCSLLPDDLLSAFIYTQLTLVISTLVISNNRLSRKENLALL